MKNQLNINAVTITLSKVANPFLCESRKCYWSAKTWEAHNKKNPNVVWSFGFSI